MLPLANHDEPLPGDELGDLFINYQWRRLLAPLATRLLNRGIYDGTEIEIDTAVLQAHLLLADLYPGLVALSISHAIIVDEKPSGTHGGTSIVGWNDRTLNAIESDDDGIVALLSDKFTPVTGNYLIFVQFAPMAAGAATTLRARIRNFTTSVIVAHSMSGLYLANLSALVSAFGIVDANGTDKFDVQTFHSSARVNTGLGRAVVDGSLERYAQVYLLRLP